MVRPDFFPFSLEGKKRSDELSYSLAMTGSVVPHLLYLDGTPKTAALKAAATGFTANFRRVTLPLSLPGLLMLWGRDVQAYEMIGNYNVIRSPIQPKDLDEATKKACHDETLKLYYDSRQQNDEMTDMLCNIEWAQASVTSFMSCCSIAPECLTAVLSGAITNLWTAIEMFTGDLWEAALNCHPQELSQLKGRRSGAEQPKMDISHIHRHDYNLAEVMGTLLKDRYKFTNYHSIKDAYSDAFARDFPDIDTIIPPEIDALDCARNLLVHRAGIVDDKFIGRTRNSGLFGQLAVGDQMPVNGPIFSTFSVATATAAASLYRAVDDWIAAH